MRRMTYADVQDLKPGDKVFAQMRGSNQTPTYYRPCEVVKITPKGWVKARSLDASLYDGITFQEYTWEPPYGNAQKGIELGVKAEEITYGPRADIRDAYMAESEAEAANETERYHEYLAPIKERRQATESKRQVEMKRLADEAKERETASQEANMESILSQLRLRPLLNIHQGYVDKSVVVGIAIEEWVVKLATGNTQVLTAVLRTAEGSRVTSIAYLYGTKLRTWDYYGQIHADWGDAVQESLLAFASFHWNQGRTE